MLKKYLRPIFFHCGYPHAKISMRRITASQKLFILMYHRVNHKRRPFFEIVVKPEHFEKQIIFLKKYFQIVDLCELKEIKTADDIKKDIIVLTFDDGYRDNYTYAFPILKKYNVPATIFLATDFISTDKLLWYDELAWILDMGSNTPDTSLLLKNDIPKDIAYDVNAYFSYTAGNGSCLGRLASRLKILSPADRKFILEKLADICALTTWPGKGDRAMLSWDEVKEMSANGISFGSHTKSHPVLSSLSVDDAQREIVDSKKIIEDQLQKSVNAFAFPFGRKEDYSNVTTQFLEDEGFEYAFSTNMGGEQLPLNNLLELKRKGVAPHPYLFL